METNRNDLFVQRDMGIYIHIPFCKQKCIYCDFPAYQNLEEYYDTYLYALVQEMTMFGDAYPKSRTKLDRKSTRLNSSHITRSRMPSSA